MWNQLLFNYFKQKSTLTQFISLVPFYTFWKHPKKGPGLWKETINMKSLLVNQNPLREFTILGINYFCYFSLISEDLNVAWDLNLTYVFSILCEIFWVANHYCEHPMYCWYTTYYWIPHVIPLLYKIQKLYKNFRMLHLISPFLTFWFMKSRGKFQALLTIFPKKLHGRCSTGF